MFYQYVACKENGEIVKGRLSAAHEEAATELLAYAGYRVISLKVKVPFLGLDELLVSLLPTLFRVKPAEIILFYRQLAMLLESGTNIAVSLELLQKQTTSHLLKKMLGEAVSDVRGGSQLSKALAKHPEVFSSVYTQLLGVGEQSGDFETVLKQVADYMEKELATAKQTKGALMMPAITLLVTLAVVGLMVMFVIPSFGKLYGTLGQELPPTVKILIKTSDIAQKYGQYLLLAVSVIFGLVYFYIRTPGGRYKWDKLLLSLPMFGRVRHLTELSRCCRSMSLLFRVGMPLTEAVPLAMQGCGNQVMVKALHDVQQDMLKGQGLSGPMAKNKLFLPMMVQMVSVGEQAGNLDVTLQAVARSFEAEADAKTRSLIALIEPLMTLFLGGTIGIIAISLFQTIYGMQAAF